MATTNRRNTSTDFLAHLQGGPIAFYTIHHGENRGSKPVILYMFYLSQKDLPLAVQHPEIPLE